MYTQLLWLCLILSDSVDRGPPGSSLHGIFLAGILEWVAMPSSKESSQSKDWTCISCIAGRFFTTESLRKPHSHIICVCLSVCIYIYMASLVAKLVKNLPAVQEIVVRFVGWEGPWRREQLPAPVFWLRKFHGLYSSWDHKEVDTTEWLSLSHIYVCVYIM